MQTGQAAEALSGDNARKLVTLGIAEPFTATITIAFYAALLLAMPFLLYQCYAFILPAFSPKERKVALPLMLMVPVLFVAGVMFGYFVVLGRAVGFLQNFNDDSFDILLQAKDYFKFAVFFLAGIGLLFQIPVGRARGDAAWDLHAEAACEEPRLRHPRDRGRRGRRDAHAGPRDDDARDGAAHRAVRAQHPAGALDRPHQAAARGRRAR